MEYIDQAALRMQTLETLSHLPPLPKTANELLMDPSDLNTDTGIESGRAAFWGEGGTVVHPIARGLWLTGRGKRANQGGPKRVGAIGIGEGEEETQMMPMGGTWKGGIENS